MGRRGLLRRVACRLGGHNWDAWVPDPQRCIERRSCVRCHAEENASRPHVLEACRCLRCGETHHAGPFMPLDERTHACGACGESEGHDFSVRYEWEDLGGWDSDFASYDEEVCYRTCTKCGFESSETTGRRMV